MCFIRVWLFPQQKSVYSQWDDERTFQWNSGVKQEACVQAVVCLVKMLVVTWRQRGYQSSILFTTPWRQCGGQRWGGSGLRQGEGEDGGWGLRREGPRTQGRESGGTPQRKELLQEDTPRVTINLQLEELGKWQCYLFFSGGGIQAEEQSLKGRSLVLYMLSGHGRQPVSSMWSLGEMGQRERHLRVFNSLRPRRLKARSLESLPRQLSRLPSGSVFTSSPPCQIQMSGNPHTHTQPSVTAPGNCSESRFPALSIPAPQHSLLLPRWERSCRRTWVLDIFCIWNISHVSLPVDLTSPAKPTHKITCSGKLYTTFPFWGWALFPETARELQCLLLLQCACPMSMSIYCSECTQELVSM